MNIKLLNIVHVILLGLALFLIWPAFQSPPPIPEDSSAMDGITHYLFADMGRQLYLQSTDFKIVLVLTGLLLIWIVFINVHHFKSKKTK